MVAKRDGVVGGTLEDGEVIRLLGDLRGDLDAGRAGADDSDPLAGELDALVGPLGGVIPVAGEGLYAGYVRHVRRRQSAQGGDEEPRREDIAGVRADLPTVRLLVENRLCHARPELDVPVQVEPFGYVLEVAQHLWLLGVTFAPLPLPAELLVERVAVDPTRRIAACTRVAVPIPSPTYAVAGFQDPCREPYLVAQLVERVQPREPGADDDRVEVGDRLRTSFQMVLLRLGHVFLLLLVIP